MDLELIMPAEQRLQLPIKRVLDFAGAALLMVVLSPILAMVGLVLHLSLPGKVIFRQVRIGKDGKPFWMYKFRTMKDLPEDILNLLLNQDPKKRVEYECFQKLADDPRLTKVGQFLRRFSLDELPQLWNVLKGDMSLIGPRPFLPDQTALYGAGYRYYCQLRPGLTGLWQVSGRNRLSFIQRAALDVYYVENWSFSLDLAIFLRTIWVVLRQDGAY
jgi:lipopolysaccharide/colanic/teichoic acid biosynthesis glycosyltransferase